MITNMATKLSPWHGVPAYQKWFARVVIGSTIVSALEDLRLRYPRLDKASLQEFEKVRAALEQEGCVYRKPNPGLSNDRIG
jgi:hypothetical protein